MLHAIRNRNVHSVSVKDHWRAESIHRQALSGYSIEYTMKAFSTSILFALLALFFLTGCSKNSKCIEIWLAHLSHLCQRRQPSSRRLSILRLTTLRPNQRRLPSQRRLPNQRRLLNQRRLRSPWSERRSPAARRSAVHGLIFCYLFCSTNRLVEFLSIPSATLCTELPDSFITERPPQYSNSTTIPQIV